MKHSESVLLEFYRLLAEGAQSSIQKNESYSFLSVTSSTYPNFLFRPHLNNHNAKETLDIIKTKIETGFPAVMICSLTDTNVQTIQLLEKYAAYGKFWTAMTLDLKKLDQPKTDLNLKIELIDHKKQFKDWAKIVEMALTGGNIDDKIFYQMSKHDNASFYLAYLDAVPIATSLVVQKGDEVGVYLIATLEPFRKKGIGKYITAYTLWKAKQSGASFAHLQATELGKPVYQKIGFEIMGKVPVFKIA